MQASGLLAHFNGLDYVFLVLVFFSLVVGFKRGFWCEVIAIVSWIAAFAISILFANDLALYFEQYVKSSSVAIVLSFILLFLVTLLLGQLINWSIGKLVTKTGFMFLDHLFGGVFGLIRGGLVILFFAFVISSMGYNDREWFQKAQTVHVMQGVLTWLQTRVVMPATIEQEATEKKSDGKSQQVIDTKAKTSEKNSVTPSEGTVH